jgi:hypothetical protein
VRVALVDERGGIVPGSVGRFGGKGETTIPAKETLLSDPIDLRARALDRVAVRSIFSTRPPRRPITTSPM